MRLTSTKIPDQLSFWNEWHRTRGATGQDAVHRMLREVFLDAVGPHNRRRRVLDLGCGQGHDVLAFMKAGYQVCGVDFSPVAIAQAQRAVRSRRWFRRWFTRGSADLRVHDISHRLPFDDGYFDGVFSHLALHYFHDDVTRGIFREIKRVTRPGGILVFSVKSVEDPYFGTGDKLGEFVFCRKGHARHFFNESYVKDLLDGWQTEDIASYTGYYACTEPSAFVSAVARKPR